MSEVAIRNRQRSRRIHARMLKRILRVLLVELLRLGDFEVCVHLVSSSRIAWLNARFLQHSGSTDVITFDAHDTRPPGRIAGEIFISVNDAVLHARKFRTSWQSEIVRYVIHGLLHMRGFDDLQPARRRVMKRQENRLLRQIARRFPLEKLGRI
ncbi:MAG: rRNA maturation RNase YbeY [Verrucomicrobia bacterium]|nr:rRNA maturation RNase YbeY [Verrucomicrobiota bacterium]